MRKLLRHIGVLGSAVVCSASRDINKVIRARYGDQLYSELAQEASNGWRSSELDLWHFVHPTGWYTIHQREASSIPHDLVNDMPISSRILHDRFDSRFQCFETSDEALAKRAKDSSRLSQQRFTVKFKKLLMIAFSKA